MKTLFWALICLLCIVVIYTAVGTLIYTIFLGKDIWSAIKLTLRDFLFWKENDTHKEKHGKKFPWIAQVTVKKLLLNK